MVLMKSGNIAIGVTNKYIFINYINEFINLITNIFKYFENKKKFKPYRSVWWAIGNFNYFTLYIKIN